MDFAANRDTGMSKQQTTGPSLHGIYGLWATVPELGPVQSVYSGTIGRLIWVEVPPPS